VLCSVTACHLGSVSANRHAAYITSTLHGRFLKCGLLRLARCMRAPPSLARSAQVEVRNLQAQLAEQGHQLAGERRRRTALEAGHSADNAHNLHVSRAPVPVPAPAPAPAPAAPAPAAPPPPPDHRPRRPAETPASSTISSAAASPPSAAAEASSAATATSTARMLQEAHSALLGCNRQLLAEVRALNSSGSLTAL
jgi:hypothetical protein